MSQQLDEKLSFKNFIAGALIGAAGYGAAHINRSPDYQHGHKMPAAVGMMPKAIKRKASPEEHSDKALNKYRSKIDRESAEKIAKFAHKYASPDFPKAQDLLSVIGVESAFDPEAVSKLKKDPARGLMQVRPGIWKLRPSDLQSAEDQIRHGANILRYYYKKLGSEQAAIKAYNIGETNYRKGIQHDRAQIYQAKIDKEKKLYAESRI